MPHTGRASSSNPKSRNESEEPQWGLLLKPFTTLEPPVGDSRCRKSPVTFI